MNLAVKFNLLKNTQPHYSYTPESCLENDSYKLYFDRTILTDIHINIVPGDQEGLFKLAVQLRKFFNSVIYNTATGYVLLVYLTNI
jgi:hypothetical protein